MASSVLAVVTLAGCGEESNTRQFAGGPQTPRTEESPVATSASAPIGSPTAQPTQMPVADLLAPRGTTEFIPIVQEDRLALVNVLSGSSTDVWQDEAREIWGAATDAIGTRAAVLSAPAGEVTGWSVDFLEADGSALGHVEFGVRDGTPGTRPDAVAAGRGGITWIGETDSVAVSLPSGGLQQVYTDGSRVRLLSASGAKRPAAVAVTQDAGTIAYIDQPTGSAGSGIFAGSMKAKPIDPLVVLPVDRSGNRSARDLAWVPSSNRLATVIEGKAMGSPQGDLFFIDAANGRPTLAWTSPAGRETWSVDEFAFSADGQVVTFLTNPTNPESHKPSSVWVMQVDGTALERFELPVELRESRLAFSPVGVAVAGSVWSVPGEPPLGAVYRISPQGQVLPVYEETPPATPVASPQASPASSPVASPSGVASPLASPIASPVGSSSPGTPTAEA